MKLKLLTSVFFLFTICQMASAQIFFYEDFNDGDLSAWANHDLDGDGHQWVTYNFGNILPSLGDGSIVSFSYIDEALTPDNLLVSPAIDLTNAPAAGVVLTYEGLGDYELNDRYALYITTTNDPQEIIATTPVIDTLTEYEFSEEIDMSPYIGQTVYLSFRHYESSDLYYIALDNIEIKVPYSNDLSLDELYFESRYINPDEAAVMEIKLKNRGNAPVTNSKISWNDGSGDNIVEIDTSIQPNEVIIYTLPNSFVYSDVASHDITVSILEANGEPDTLTFNNTRSTSLVTISQTAAQKKVLIEESTGTWCGFCPRGILAMKLLDSLYADQAIGVAIHTNDVMALDEYETRSAFSSAPAIHADRVIKNVNLTLDIIPLMAEQTPNRVATIDIGGELNGQDLTINLSSTFYSNFTNANFRYGVILTENGVTGTGSAYDQANYFSNNTEGIEMGGYENLPNPVPAEQMVYDHVARALIGGYDGQEGSIPSVLTDGETVSYTFNYTFPDGANIGNYKAVGVVIDNTTGEIVNSNDLKLGLLTSTTSAPEAPKGFKLSPNPAVDMVKLDIEQGGDYLMSVHNMEGKLLSNTKLNIPSGGSSFDYDVSALAAGVYIISLATDTQSINKRLVVSKK